MVVALIGLLAFVASVSAGFVPGIAVGAGLIGLGALLALTNRTQS